LLSPGAPVFPSFAADALPPELLAMEIEKIVNTAIPEIKSKIFRIGLGFENNRATNKMF
jgi:hypothetical protein